MLYWREGPFFFIVSYHGFSIVMVDLGSHRECQKSVMRLNTASFIIDLLVKLQMNSHPVCIYCVFSNILSFFPTFFFYRIFSVLSAILYLGNVSYQKKSSGRDEGLEVGPPEVLNTLSELLKVIGCTNFTSMPVCFHDTVMTHRV